MNILTADEVLLNRLCGIVEPVEIRDATGKVLGHYTPVVSPEEAAAYARAKELFDLEEAERILAAERNTGRPLKDILAELQSLEAKG
jgi:hypothetical protein